MSSYANEDDAAAAEEFWAARRAQWAAQGYVGANDDYWTTRTYERELQHSSYDADEFAVLVSPDEFAVLVSPDDKHVRWVERNRNDMNWWWEPKLSFMPAPPAPVPCDGEMTWTGEHPRVWRKVWDLRMQSYFVRDEAGDWTTEAFMLMQSAENKRVALLRKSGRFAQLIQWAMGSESQTDEFPPVQPPKITKHPLGFDIMEVVQP